MNTPVNLHIDQSGSMPRHRDILIGDLHGGTNFGPAIAAAIKFATKFHREHQQVVLMVTDGDPFNYKKVSRARKALSGVNQHVQQLRHRGCRKMRARRTVLKSTARCDG
jgi:uncharacterized protein with von Willebrand factor type A (vWA) domain